MQNHTKKKNIPTVLKMFLIAVCGIIIGISFYSMNARLLLHNELPMPFGYGMAEVMSGSMDPAINVGDLILVKDIDTYSDEEKEDLLAESQIVVFESDGVLVIHRIVGLEDGKIITRGDANNTEDAPIDKDDVRAVYLMNIPRGGYIVSYLKSPLGILIVIGLAILLIEASFAGNRNNSDELEEIQKEIDALKKELNKEDEEAK